MSLEALGACAIITVTLAIIGLARLVRAWDSE